MIMAVNQEKREENWKKQVRDVKISREMPLHS